MKSIFHLLFASLLLFAAPLAKAANYYWDSNGTTSTLGNTGSLVWGTSANQGNLAAGSGRSLIDGTIAVVSTATTNADTMFFGTMNLALGATASNIGIVAGGVTINNITFGIGQGSQGVTLSGGGGTITLAGTAPAIYTLNSAADTIGAQLAGSAGMVKGGGGTLILTGANLYTGGTTLIGGGTLQVGNGTTGSLTSQALTLGSVGAGAGNFIVAGANANSQNMGALTFAAGDGTITSTAASGSATQTLTLASLATRGVGATGNFVLATNATASQNKIILTSTTNAPLDTGSNNLGYFFGGTEYARYDTSNNYFRAVIYGTDTNALAALSGTTMGAVTSATDVKLNGAITGQTAASVNTINLAGNNFTFDNAGVTLGVNGFLTTATSVIANGTNASTLQSTSSGGEMVFNVTAGTLTVNPGIQNNTNPSPVTKAGAGTLILAGANGYTGNSYINSGTLAVSGGSAISDSVGSVILANAAGVTFRLDANETIFGLTGGGATGGTVDVQGNTLTIADTTNQAFSGTLTGTGSGVITKTGNSTLTLNNANSFAGTINLNAGALTLAYGNTGISLMQTISSGGAINMTGGTSITVTPTPQVAFGQQTSNNPAQLNVANSGFVIGNAINITSGTATLNLTGNDNRVFFNGDITGGASGNQTLKVNSLTSNQAYHFTGVVKDGGGGILGVSVDATGTAAIANPHFFNFSNQNTFSGPIVVANTVNAQGGVYFVIGGVRTTSGLTAGSGSLGTTSPGTGSYSNTISLGWGNILDYASSANQTLGGVISGAGVVQMDGSNTLKLTNSGNSFASATVVTGTLQLDANYAGAVAINGGTFAVNFAGSVTQGVNIPRIIGGNAGATGVLSNIGAGTLTLNAPTYHSGTTKATVGGITLSHALALQNSALDTTGAGTVTLSGVTTPTFGGFTGTANLSSYLVNYGSVTALTLNPQSGNSYTYTGVIGNGSGAISLTKTGAGTQVLQGANSYSGATTLSAGTLTLSGAAGALTGTSGLTFNGGNLTLINTSAAEALVDRVNTNAIISNGGTITVTNTASGTTVYSETMGALDLRTGQLNVIQTNNNTTPAQTLTFGSGSLTTINGSARAITDTSSITFSGTSLGASAKNSIIVTGQATTGTGQIIGPWATFGTTAAAQTDYATYNITNGTTNAFGIQGAGIAGSAETAWTTAGNAYTTSAGGTVTLTGTRTITALRNTGATTVLTLASGADLRTYGVLNGVATLLTVAPGTGGVLTTPSGGGSLFVTTGSGAITISAPINNNGGNVTLVKNGTGTLTLTSTTSNFAGGVVLNAGTLSIDDVRSIGGTNNTGGSTAPITVNGSSTISMPTNNLVANFGTGAVTIANGATLTVSSASRGDLRFGGAVTGSGGVTATSGSFWSKYSFTSTSNSFAGAITDSRSGNDGIANALFSFNSISNNAGDGNIILNGANDSGIDYGSGAIAALVMDYRQLVLANNNTVFINNASSQALNINTDIGFSGTGNRQIRFGISGRSGSGVSTFAGKLTDSPGGAFSPTFNGGTWVVSGNNTYSGPTGVSGGSTVTMSGNNTLSGQITVSGNSTLTLSGDNSGMTSLVALSTNTSNNPRLNINSATALGTGILNFGGGAASDVVTIDNTSAGTVNVSTANTIAMNRDFTFVGTQSLSLGTGTTTLGGMTAGTSRQITVTANTLTLAGAIVDGTNGLSGINKKGAGTLVLSGTGSTYTGPTSINTSGGTLVGIGTNAFGSTSGIAINGSTAVLSLRGDTNTPFVKTSDSSAYAVTTGASGVTINVDQATIAGAGAKTMTIGTLGLNAAITNGTNFTGAHNTSLSIGAVTTGASASGTETLTNNIASTGSLTLASISVLRTGTPTLKFDGTGDTIVTGTISQAAATALTYAGTGTLTLNGASSSYTGITTVSSGTLLIGADAPSGSNGALGNASSNVSLGGASSATLLTNGAFTVARNIDVASGAGTTVIGGNTASSSSFTGNIALSKVVTLQAFTGGTVDFATGTWTSGNNIVNVGLSGKTGIVKLSNTLNTSGAVNVNFGTFSVNGTLSGGGSDLTVASGAKLGGGGSITKNINIQSGGFFAPGNSIGTITETGDVTIAGTFQAELGTAGATPAAGVSDRTNITGNLTLTGGTLQLIDNAGANGDGSAGAGAYRLITFSGTRTGTFATVTNPLSSTLHESVVYNGASNGTVDLNLYRLASASTITTPVAIGNVRVGGTLSTALSVTNTATNDGFSEGLNASAGAVTGDASFGGSSVTNLAAGAGSSSTLTGVLSTTTAGSKSGNVTVTLQSNGTGTSGYGNTGITDQTIALSGAAYDFANANYTGATLAFGNVHVGASVTAQTVAFGNQTVTSASFQDLLDVSATTGNAKVTATGFTGLAASAGGVTTSNLSFGVNTATVGSLASTASLTLTSNANGVSGLSNGTATVVGSPTAITTTGNVYSGLSTWNTNGNGTWGTYASNFGTNWDSGGTPGIDTGFTSSDTATFGNVLTTGTASATLDGAIVSLKAITFDNTNSASYSIDKGTGSGTLSLNNGGSDATITNTNGSHSITTDIALTGTGLTVGGNSAGTTTLSGVISGSGATLTKSGTSTAILSATNTYTGTTSVSAGTLQVNGSIATVTGSGNVTVANATGATLSGTGIIGNTNTALDITVTGPLGALMVGNTHGPDNSPAGSPQLLTLETGTGGVITLSGMVQFDIFAKGGTADESISGLKIWQQSSSNDQLKLTSTQTTNVLSGTSILSVKVNNGLTFANGDSWRLFDWGGLSTSGFTGSFTEPTNVDLPSITGYNWITTRLYSDGIISLQAVPEPSRAVLMLIGAAGLLMRRKRKG